MTTDVCEYCGCQDIEVIARLTAEHDLLRELGRDLAIAAAAGDHPAATACAERMIAVLEPHTTVEEVGLFPAMADDYPDQIDRLTGDHRRIDAALRHVVQGQDGWARVADAAVHELFDHILKEQDGVFPAALSILGPEQWERVAAARPVPDRPPIAAGS